MKKIINTPNAPQAIGPYNQGIVTPQYIFLSGQIPMTAEGNLVGGDIKQQTVQCLQNIENILKETQLTRKNIIKTTVFLKNLGDFPEFNKAYADFFEGSDYPARSTVEVSALPKDVDIEIEAIAVK